MKTLLVMIAIMSICSLVKADDRILVSPAGPITQGSPTIYVESASPISTGWWD